MGQRYAWVDVWGDQQKQVVAETCETCGGLIVLGPHGTDAANAVTHALWHARLSRHADEAAEQRDAREQADLDRLDTIAALRWTEVQPDDVAWLITRLRDLLT